MALPIGVTAIAAMFVDPKMIGAAILPPGIACVPLALLGLFQVRRTHVHVTSLKVHVVAGFYKVEIDREAIIINSMRQLSKKDDPAQPRWRTNGICFPGYAAGWFRLRSGRSAFVAARGGPVTLIPLRGGFDLIVSSAEAKSIEALA
jgi:hypothetical protein